jgi:ElaB/YqjD/DUF883 family membrane-anchored ribosome-binding protein
MSYREEGRDPDAVDPDPDSVRREPVDPDRRDVIEPDPVRQEAVDPDPDPVRRQAIDPDFDPVRQDAVDPYRQDATDSVRREPVDPVPEPAYQGVADPDRQEPVDPYRQDTVDATPDSVRREAVDPVPEPAYQGVADPDPEPARRDDQSMTHAAADEAKGIAQVAREEGRELAGQAREELRSLAGDAREQLRQQIADQSAKATESLRRLGDQFDALAEGRTEEAGPLSGYAHSAAHELRHAAGRMEDRGFEGLLDDTRRFARNRPAAFLGIAAVAGFAAGRLLRGGAEVHKQHRDDADRSGAEYAPPAREEDPER